MVTEETLPEVAHEIPALFGRLAELGVAPAGPPFFRYHLINMPGPMDVEAGIAVAEAIPGDDRIVAGVLPGGRYATVDHLGPPSSLRGATADLLAWAEQNGHAWDRRIEADGEHWAARIEFYQTDPAEQPDTGKWLTELAFKLAD